jgi:hypothetical protein
MSDLISVAAVVGLFLAFSNVAITYPNWFFGRDRIKVTSKREKWITPIMLALYLIFAYKTYGYLQPVKPNLLAGLGVAVVTLINFTIYLRLRKGKTL